MASVELATAYVSLVPSLKGAGNTIGRELGGAGIQGVAQRSGRSLGSRILRGVTAAIGAAGGLAAAIGLRNLGRDALASAQGIQGATATLTGLLGSAQDATTTMAALREVARDSPIEYQAYLKGAESMAYMGYQGQEAADILQNVGAAVTAAGGDASGMDRATSAMLDMVNSGRVYSAQLNQISATGIPVFSGLAEHFNTNIANVREMVSAGEVGIEDVMAVIQNASGDTFQSMLEASDATSQTFANQWAIAKDNIVTALGESLVPALDALAPVIGDLGGLFEGMAQKAGDWLKGAAQGLATFIQEFRAGAGPGGKFRDVLEGVRDAVMGVFNFIVDTAIPAAKNLANWLKENNAWVVPLTAALLGMAVAIKGILVVNALIAAFKLWRAGTLAQTIAQLKLNIALIANPIGIVVTAIAGLVAAFVVAYKNSETFRRIVDAAWAGIKKAANAVWTFLRDKVFKPLVQWFKDTGARFVAMKDALVGAWNKVKSALKAGWDWIYRNVIMAFAAKIKWLQVQFQLKVMQIRRIWEGIKFIFRAVWDWIKANVIDRFVRGVNNLRDRFSNIVGRIKDVWSGIKDAFRNVYNWIRDNVFGKFRSTLDNLLDKVRTIRDRIGDAWRNIANKFRNPINWVINTVWNDGIAKAFNGAASALGISTRLPDEAAIPAFAKGGYHKGGWALVGEKGPELVNFSDPGRVYTAKQTNEIMNSGPVGDLKDDLAAALGSAAGSVANFTAGGAVDGLGAAAGAILKPLKSLITNTVGQWGNFGRLGGAVGTRAIDEVLKWVGKKEEAELAKTVGAGFGHGGSAPGSGAWRRPSRGPITSGYGPRWGSFHAGIDIAGGGPTYAAADGTVYRVGTGILGGRTGVGIGLSHGGGVFTYYGHNPYGGPRVRPGQKVQAGQHIGYQGATGNVTGTHLHFELHRGGWGRNVNPRSLGIFDNGGWIPDGGMAMNLSGKPEAVLDPDESAALKAGLAGGGGPLVNTLVVRDERTAIDELERMRRRELTRARISGVRR